MHNIFPVLSWAIFRRQYVAAISAPEPQGGTRIKASEQIIRATIDLVLAIAAALRCNPGDSTISSDGFRRAQALVSVGSPSTSVRPIFRLSPTDVPFQFGSLPRSRTCC